MVNNKYQTIITSRNEKIYYIKILPADIKAIVMISHGYAGHSGQYNDLIHKLLAHGYGVYAYDHRGQGRSEAERGHLEAFEYFIEDMNEIIKLIRADFPDTPLFTFGHSMGGLVAFVFGTIYPEMLNGQIFSGAALGMPWGTQFIPSWIFIFIDKYLNKIRIYPVIRRKASRNKEFIKSQKQDPYVLKYATAGFFYEFIYRGIRKVNELAGNYNLPCLFLHGKADKIIPYQSSAGIVKRIKSSEKELKVYDNLNHELVQEPERQLVIEDVIRWLDMRVC